VAALTRAIKIDASLAGALQQQVNGLRFILLSS
jgi:hypothetical protein